MVIIVGEVVQAVGLQVYGVFEIGRRVPAADQQVRQGASSV